VNAGQLETVFKVDTGTSYKSSPRTKIKPTIIDKSIFVSHCSPLTICDTLFIFRNLENKSLDGISTEKAANYPCFPREFVAPMQLLLSLEVDQTTCPSL